MQSYELRRYHRERHTREYFERAEQPVRVNKKRRSQLELQIPVQRREEGGRTSS